MNKNAERTRFVNAMWFRGSYLAAVSLYVYLFMEWVFFVTKPSFMSYFSLWEKLATFLVSGLLLVIPVLALELVLTLSAGRTRFLALAAAIIPALITAALVLILVDNFTYTVFQFGIVSSVGIWRGVYGLGFLVTFLYLIRQISKGLEARSQAGTSFGHYAVFALILVSALLFGYQLLTMRPETEAAALAGVKPAELPNIVLLGFDGVNAANMSVYGYERATTPNISAMADGALIAEDAFSNGANTGGSLTSILTGKLSTRTHVIYPPDILVGQDAYEHLPGLLKQLGYTTVQITDYYYGDAYSRNIKDGFDIANFRAESKNPLTRGLSRVGNGASPYFIGVVYERIIQRLEHIFYIKVMPNPYRDVTQPLPALTDQQRFDGLISYLKDTKGPVFVHVHMLGTHGVRFRPRVQHFSAGQKQTQKWMPDFYDDAILDADRYAGELFDFLRSTGKLDHTIVVIYSDHGEAHNPRNRVPLIFWFPGGQHAGKIPSNVELVDIAPTLLAYLGVPQPAWMDGRSLLSNDLPQARAILSPERGDVLVKGTYGRLIDVSKIKPPFFQIGRVNLIVCDRWFTLELDIPGLTSGKIEGSTATCNPGDVPSPLQAMHVILQSLKDSGYDVSSYPSDIPMK